MYFRNIRNILAVTFFVILLQGKNLIAQEFIEIPVIINILRHSEVDERYAKKAVDDASKILEKARIKLKTVKVNKNVINPSDNDARIDKSELGAVINKAGEEITKRKDKKGIKITFARDALVGSLTPGHSFHRFPSMVVEKRKTRSKTASTIAHEACHILTIRDHSNDPSNLMAPSIDEKGNPIRRGTGLTDQQIREITKGAKLVGKVIKPVSSTDSYIKESQQFGAVLDSAGDLIGEADTYLDLFYTNMESESGHESITAMIALTKHIPDSVLIEASYSLLIDSDNNINTGIDIAGFSGIDKVIRTDVSRKQPQVPLSVSGYLIDYIREGKQSPLPFTPKVINEPLLDVFGKKMTQTQILIDIPKSLLELSTHEVFVGITSETHLGIHDVSSLIFDLDWWFKSPTLTVSHRFVSPGEIVSFEVMGLAPSSKFDLFIDEQCLFAGTLGTEGGFVGKFIFPSLLPTGDHFITVQDSSGEFAFNVVSVPK